MDPEIERLTLELYERIIQSANYFIAAVSKNSIQSLRTIDNPTFQELAEVYEYVSDVIGVLVEGHDDLLGFQAKEHAMLMSAIAQAIVDNDEDLLTEATARLSGKPGNVPDRVG